MESFLPSEIARLVYGYLEEEECNTAAQAYLETSGHLKECLAVAKKGRKFNTKIYGLSLVDLLDLLSEAISFVKEHKKELRQDNKKDYRLLSLLQIDTSSCSTTQEPLNENHEKIDDLAVSVIQNTNFYDNRLPRKSDSSPKFYDDSNFNQFQKGEGNMCRINPVISSPKSDENISSNFKVKEENEEGGHFQMEETSQSDDTIPNIEPEVQISSPSGDIHGNLSRHDAPSVNVITNPIMVSGRPSQLVCQPYNMVQMLPTVYSGALNPNISTVYFPHNAISQHPVMSVQHQASAPAVQPALYQTTVRTSESSTVQSVWTKTKDSSQPQKNSTSKLRPIAPKITQPLSNTMKVQVVHTKENALVEPNTTNSKRILRSRKRSLNTASSKNQSTLCLNDKK